MDWCCESVTEDSIKIASWSLIPAIGTQWWMSEGLLVMNTSLNLVGEFTT